MKRNILRIPRKTKKCLKSKILGNNSPWDSKELRITKVERFSRYRHMNPTCKGLTVLNFELG